MCLQLLPASSDPFTRFLYNVLLGLYHRLLGQDLGTGKTLDAATGHTSYSSPGIDKASSVVTTILASVLPILTIWVFNQLSSANVRNGVTAVFTAGFAFVIAAFSEAKRAEIFVATAT